MFINMQKKCLLEISLIIREKELSQAFWFLHDFSMCIKTEYTLVEYISKNKAMSKGFWCMFFLYIESALSQPT